MKCQCTNNVNEHQADNIYENIERDNTIIIYKKILRTHLKILTLRTRKFLLHLLLFIHKYVRSLIYLLILI